jgi:hypothetical protein
MTRLICIIWYRGHLWGPVTSRIEDWFYDDTVGRMIYYQGKSNDPSYNFTVTHVERCCTRCGKIERIE